ncbi:hypothetical protein QL285_009092 [Trifolium repens]|nr:hypothetical protein QL285_009092 [Trifolium repens]
MFFDLFGSGTKFEVAPDSTDFPPHQFCFKNFKEVQTGNFKVNYLYEIIGVVHEVVKTQTLASGKKPCTNLILTDEGANMVDVTLWEAFSIQLMNFITSRQDKGPIVLILTHAQCKLGDNGRPNFCNNWSGSKLLINFDHPDVEKFKSSYKDIDKSQGATQDFTQVSSTSQISNSDPFSNLSQFKSICQMKSFTKDSYCNTIGTAKKFNPNQFGWYYESCTKFTKSSRGQSDNYVCSCGEVVKSPLARFKVVAQVEQDGHKADFVFWDNECQTILGRTAEDIRETMKKVGEDDPKIYPTYLDDILNKEFAFKVKYQPYYRQASINQLSSESTIINNIKTHIAPSKASPMFSKSVSTLPDHSNQSANDNTECSDSVAIPLVSLSATDENDLDVISNITPAKRQSGEIEKTSDIPITTTNDGQVSSTKIRMSSRKGGKPIKLE